MPNFTAQCTENRVEFCANPTGKNTALFIVIIYKDHAGNPARILAKRRIFLKKRRMCRKPVDVFGISMYNNSMHW